MGQNAKKIIFVVSNTHKYVAKEGGRNLICCRAPHGARGLKPEWEGRDERYAWSRPARGAWIETILGWRWHSYAHVAPRTGRVD